MRTPESAKFSPHSDCGPCCRIAPNRLSHECCPAPEDRSRRPLALAPTRADARTAGDGDRIAALGRSRPRPERNRSTPHRRAHGRRQLPQGRGRVARGRGDAAHAVAAQRRGLDHHGRQRACRCGDGGGVGRRFAARRAWPARRRAALGQLYGTVAGAGCGAFARRAAAASGDPSHGGRQAPGRDRQANRPAPAQPGRPAHHVCRPRGLHSAPIRVAEGQVDTSS